MNILFILLGLLVVGGIWMLVEINLAEDVRCRYCGEKVSEDLHYHWCSAKIAAVYNEQLGTIMPVMPMRKIYVSYYCPICAKTRHRIELWEDSPYPDHNEIVCSPCGEHERRKI